MLEISVAIPDRIDRAAHASRAPCAAWSYMPFPQGTRRVSLGILRSIVLMNVFAFAIFYGDLRMRGNRREHDGKRCRVSHLFLQERAVNARRNVAQRRNRSDGRLRVHLLSRRCISSCTAPRIMLSGTTLSRLTSITVTGLSRSASATLTVNSLAVCVNCTVAPVSVRAD